MLLSGVVASCTWGASGLVIAFSERNFPRGHLCVQMCLMGLIDSSLLPKKTNNVVLVLNLFT